MQIAAERNVGRAIKRVRFWLSEVRGRTVRQGELAELVAKATGTKPFSQPAISEWEGNGRAPAFFIVGMAQVLSEELGRPVSVDDLLSDEFKKPWFFNNGLAA
jgi:hypothetical protein